MTLTWLSTKANYKHAYIYPTTRMQRIDLSFLPAFLPTQYIYSHCNHDPKVCGIAISSMQVQESQALASKADRERLYHRPLKANPRGLHGLQLHGYSKLNIIR